jgi:2'-5' RNA ligase
MSNDTALICRVPEAERYIGRYRERYDPSARRNVPAHVTILYPFVPLAQIDAGVIARLREIAAGVRRFDYRLAQTRRFPVALYLAPEPDHWFAALTDAVWAAFPDYPPFEGKFTTVVPHVTVAHGDEPQLCEIEVELRIALAAGVQAHCSEMVLIESSSGRWEEMHRFALGASPVPTAPGGVGR